MNGRDHNHYGFTMWLAGGGVKGGHVHGATDEFGFQAVENKVHVHDLHATILHLLGFDHEQLHLPLRRPRLPPDRRARQGGQGGAGVICATRGHFRGLAFSVSSSPPPVTTASRSMCFHLPVSLLKM